MLDRDYYEGWNINDHYETKEDVIRFLEELEKFDERFKVFLGPKKVKSAGVDARRSIRVMREILKDISGKIQMTKQDYESDYSDD